MTPDTLAAAGLGWLWRASWQASVLVLLVLLAQWVCRARLEPRWRFALWWLVLLRLALPLAPESAWSVFNWAPAAPLPSPLPQREIVIPPSPSLSAIPSPAFPNLELAPISHPKVSRTQTPPKPAPQRSPWSILAWIWLAGTALYGGRILLGTYVISRRLKCHTPLRTPEILEVLEACRREMGLARAPEVWVTTAVDSPALFGLWRCRLLVPPHLPDTFSPNEWRHVFRHELAHLRRRDPQINGLMLLLQALHWFNPLVWLAMRRMRADRELACDAAALACAPATDARAYGDTILKLLADASRPAFAPSLVGILEDKSLIKQRIRQIAGFKQTRRWPILAATLLATLCVFAMTDAQSPNNHKSSNQKTGGDIAHSPEASKTASPSNNESVKATEIQADSVNVNTLVLDGRVLLEAGKLREAEAKLEQAIKEDPNNMPAKYYRNLAKEAQFRQAESKRTLSNHGKLVPVEEAWKQPDANPFGAMNHINTRPRQQLIKNKLETIVLDQYPTTSATAEVPLGKVLEALAELSRLHDPDKQGVNFRIKYHLEGVTQTNGSPVSNGANTNLVFLKDLGAEVLVRITPPLRNVRLRDVLDAIEKCAECPQQPGFTGIKYSVEDFAVIFSQRVPGSEQLHNRLFRVDPNTFIQGLEISRENKSFPQNSNSKVEAGKHDELTQIHWYPGQIEKGVEKDSNTASNAQTASLFTSQIDAPYDPSLMASTSGPTNRPTATRTIQDYVRQFFSTATGIRFGGTPITNTATAFSNDTNNPIRPMFFNDRTGVLFVRATLEELELVDRCMQVLNFPPAQINLKARVFAIDPTNAWVLQQALLKPKTTGSPETNSTPSPLILTSAQFQVLTNQLYLVEPGCEISRNAPSVTTLDGREASFNPKSHEFKLSILPSTDAGTPIINLAIEFGLNISSQAANNSLVADLSLSTTAQLIDNQTLVLQSLSAAGSKGKKLYVLCVTPTIIDPAGNRVYAEK